jgi:hypothetical protein
MIIKYIVTVVCIFWLGIMFSVKFYALVLLDKEGGMAYTGHALCAVSYNVHVGGWAHWR